MAEQNAEGLIYLGKDASFLRLEEDCEVTFSGAVSLT
jgi:hypothetical protein